LREKITSRAEGSAASFCFGAQAAAATRRENSRKNFANLIRIAG
jgi:hypothetical protein